MPLLLCAIAISHKMLRDPGVVCDTCAADGEHTVPGLGLMVNALAPPVNTMLLISMDPVTATAVVLETPKVAISFGPFGTVVGVQLAGLLQSLSTGSAFHVALPA